jgi:hypothetical protein
MPTRVSLTEGLNHARYAAGQDKGHYESFYQRANHPTRPLAFWIRYTVFSPKGQPDAAIGELWAVFFDGETGQHVVAKEEHPVGAFAFDRNSFGATVSGSVLTPGALRGECSGPAGSLGWDLTYDGSEAPIFLLPVNMYDTAIPKAKSLVGLPLATYRGRLRVDGREVDVDGWVGSQNHNWGSQHTDHYAFAQVAGFDNAPDSFLEVVSAQVKMGPVRTPLLTFLVLRHNGREHSLVSLRNALRAKAKFDYFSWDFATSSTDVQLSGRVTAPADAFVGLNYYNPPGGIKHCLNTKIGSCEITVTDAVTGTREVLRTAHRALFEILTDDKSHGITIRA